MNPSRARSRPSPIPLPALAAAGLLACAPSAAPPAPAAGDAATPERPALVVLVVVDQLRADMVTRYADLYRHGFRRLAEEGFAFTQASHRHAGTYTAPGHATLSTGSFPSHHGIVANEWALQTPGGWRSVYNTFDSTSAIVGFEELAGRSPRPLLRDGLADWVQAADPEARVVSLSTKDRAAILLAAHSRGQVYWQDSQAGGFVTSAYYRDAYPDWVERYNREIMPTLYADSVWRSEVPAAARARSRPDTNAFEFDGVHTFFPHDAREEVRRMTPYRFHEWVRYSPRPDGATLGLAEAAMEALDLGRRGVTDYLALSFSQVDYVGHRYGPFSREQLDDLLHLDRVLGELMDALDRRVGEGRWVMALSADHGVLELPEWRREQGKPGRRVSREELGALSDDLNEAVAAGGGAEAIRDRIAAQAREASFVAAVYPRAGLLRGEAPDSFAPLFRNSLYPGRYAGMLGRFDLDVRLTEGTLADGTTHGTTHGSPYWYDRHVPLFFLGAGIEPGRSEEGVYTVDVAPTLAGLAGIPFPDDLDGRPILAPSASSASHP